MIRRPPRSTQSRSSAASDVYKRQVLQQPALLVRPALLLLHGHPPVRQVLDGSLARQPREDLDHRHAHVRRLGRCGPDRLRGADELRLAVDRLPGQGRPQRDRSRILVQRREPRPEPAHPRVPAAGDHRRAGGDPRPARARARRRATDRRGQGRGTARAHGPGTGRGALMSATTQETLEREPWTGPARHYDIVKEGVIATFVVLVLTVVLAAIFSSPDDPALTFQGWAKSAPDNLYATTVAELAGTSDSATYGPPYNTNGDGQAMGPIAPQKWAGVHQPVDPPNDFVINPLSSLSLIHISEPTR